MQSLNRRLLHGAYGESVSESRDRTLTVLRPQDAQLYRPAVHHDRRAPGADCLRSILPGLFYHARRHSYLRREALESGHGRRSRRDPGSVFTKVPY
jgi:hypothetical protein